jgi:hypothetical protein
MKKLPAVIKMCKECPYFQLGTSMGDNQAHAATCNLLYAGSHYEWPLYNIYTIDPNCPLEEAKDE